MQTHEDPGTAAPFRWDLKPQSGKERSVQRTKADGRRAGRNVWDCVGDEERDVRDEWAEGGVAAEWDGKGIN